jgi:gas vesicle protein
MISMKKGESTTFVTGLAIGVGTGVVIGMFLAPKSGRDTRDAIRTSAAEGAQNIRQCGAEFRGTLKDLIRALTRQRNNLSAGMEASKKAYRKVAGRTVTESPETPNPGTARKRSA